MPRTPKVTLQQCIDALMLTGGLKTQAAQKLGISHAALSVKIKNSKKLQKAVLEAQEMILDMSEGNVFVGVKEKDPGYTRWLLEHKGDSRGYRKAQKIGIDGKFTHAGDKDAPVKIVVERKIDE